MMLRYVLVLLGVWVAISTPLPVSEKSEESTTAPMNRPNNPESAQDMDQTTEPESEESTTAPMNRPNNPESAQDMDQTTEPDGSNQETRQEATQEQEQDPNSEGQVSQEMAPFDPSLTLSQSKGEMDPYMHAKCILKPNVDDPESHVNGLIIISQKKDETGPVFIDIHLRGIDVAATGVSHGFNVHEQAVTDGRCDTTGGHFNPEGLDHGDRFIDTRHVGDLGNIMVDESGEFRGYITDENVTFTGPNSIIGKSLVVHAGEDDLGQGGDAESLATGNAGERLACCNIILDEGNQETGQDVTQDQILREAALLLHEHHVHNLHHPHEGHNHRADLYDRVKTLTEPNSQATPNLVRLPGIDTSVHSTLDAAFYWPDHYEGNATWVHAYCDLQPSADLPGSTVQGRIDISTREDKERGVFFDIFANGFDISQTAGHLYGLHVHENPVQDQRCNSTGGFYKPSRAAIACPADFGNEHAGNLGDHRVSVDGLLDHLLTVTIDATFEEVIGKSIVVHSLDIINYEGQSKERLACCNIILTPST